MLVIEVLEIVARRSKLSKAIVLSAVNKELRKKLIPVIWRNIGSTVGCKENVYLRSYMNNVCPEGTGMLIAPIWSALKSMKKEEFQAVGEIFLEVTSGRLAMMALVQYGDKTLPKLKSLRRVHLILKVTYDNRDRLTDFEHIQEYLFRLVDPEKVKTILRTDWPEVFTSTTLKINETALIFPHSEDNYDKWNSKGWYNKLVFGGEKALIVQPRAGGMEMKTIKDCPGLKDLSVLSQSMSGLFAWIGTDLTRLTLMTSHYCALPIHSRVILPFLEELVVNRHAFPIFKEVLFIKLSKLVLINKYKDGNYETAKFKGDLSSAGRAIRSAFALQLASHDDKMAVSKIEKIALSDFLFHDAVQILRDAQLTASTMVFDFNTYSYEMSFHEGEINCMLAEIVAQNSRIFSAIDHLYLSPELMTIGPFWTNLKGSYIACLLHKLLNTAALLNLKSCHLLEFPSSAEHMAYPFLYPQKWGVPSAEIVLDFFRNRTLPAELDDKVKQIENSALRDRMNDFMLNRDVTKYTGTIEEIRYAGALFHLDEVMALPILSSKGLRDYINQI